MDYTVSPSGEETFVILKVTGNITRQTIMPGVVAAHALGGKLALDCYLVDATDATNIETITDNYTFAYSDMRPASPCWSALTITRTTSSRPSPETPG